MAIPTCPVCTSRKWRKAPGTGELICSEGHVLQGYRNETNEVTDIGAHTVRLRKLRARRRLRAAEDKGNPDTYYGPRARYLYYQCRQLILRHQIERLIAVWGLPAEANNICRTMWLLALDILPQQPPPQPWLHAQAAGEPDSNGDKDQTVEDDIDVEEGSEPQQSKPEDSSDDGGDAEAQLNREVEQLLREASETDSNSERKKLNTSEGQRAYNRNTRYSLYDSVAMNISILALTCWWLRLPVVYSDFIDLINTYRLPYLSVIPLLPDNMQLHLSTALRQELTPTHAPTVAALHVITRRIARRLRLVHGVEIPELNAAPILWRAVRAFQGPPILYAMAKKLMERLQVPLMIHPSLAPRPLSGLTKLVGDWAPVEVTMAAVIVIVLKLVYGFQENLKVVPEDDDPALCFPPLTDYVTALRLGRENNRMSFSSILAAGNELTADTLRDEELDKYLVVAERALAVSHLGNIKSTPFKDLMSIYDQVHHHSPTPSSHKAIQPRPTPPEGLRRPESSSKEPTIMLPGEILTIYSPDDPLGKLPSDYALLIDTASTWSGVDHTNINHLIATLERRLKRATMMSANISNTSDSESDGEHIDLEPADTILSEGEEADKTFAEGEDESEAPTRAYRMGSQHWRGRVHNRLNRGDRKRDKIRGDSSSHEAQTTPEGSD